MAGFFVVSRMRNASAMAAGRSLEPLAGGADFQGGEDPVAIVARPVGQGPDAVLRQQDGHGIAGLQAGREPLRPRQGHLAGRGAADLAAHAVRAVEDEHVIARFGRACRPSFAAALLAFGSSSGRASAIATIARMSMRPAMSRSSVICSFRLALRPMSRNCIAPQSIVTERRRLSRWMITGMLMPSSPQSMNGRGEREVHRPPLLWLDRAAR